MTVPNVTSFTAAAREKGCSRSSIYYAAARGLLNTVDIGSVTMIVRDRAYEAYTPRDTGLRSRKAPDALGPAPLDS